MFASDSIFNKTDQNKRNTLEIGWVLFLSNDFTELQPSHK